MIFPTSLKAGDQVAIVSPAKLILKEEIDFAIHELESRGLRVRLGKHVFNSWNRFAGSDEERLEDVQDAINEDTIRAIFFARGGYGSIRIIDQLDFSKLKRNAKWMVGFSDITVFHNHLNALIGIATCHGPMPLNMINQEVNRISSKHLLDTLFGNVHSIEFPNHRFNCLGVSRGELFGGNLSVLNSLIGTDSMVNPSGKILFIEDLCEELYHLDRMLYQLKKASILNQLSGILIGSFTDMTDVSGWFTQSDAYSIIHEQVKGLGIPVAYNFPAGHQANNLALVMGRKYKLEVTEEGSILS